MTNLMRGLGTQWESDITKWLQMHGWPWAKRKARAGGKDDGDVWLSERIPFVIEAKTARKTTDRANLGGWLNELRAEVTNAKAQAGAIVFKRRGTTDVARAVVIMEMQDLQALLLLAYGEETPPPGIKRRKLTKVR